MSDKIRKRADIKGGFFSRPGVTVYEISVGPGVPFGIETITNSKLGIGGAYGTWGDYYDNATLPDFIYSRLGITLNPDETMDLASLGFINRHHITSLTDEQHLEVEVEVGAKLLREAATACGWKMEEVDAVLIGMSGPVADDYTERIARAAGVPESAIKVSIHKACDGSVGALHLVLNPDLPVHKQLGVNLAKELTGKKVLVGGIEGLSRFLDRSRDISALQLFGNGAGVIGVIPGKTMQFLVGKSHEVYDEEGLLEVSMYYPHSRLREEGHTMLEVSIAGENHVRVAGLMHEPENKMSVVMAGPMGMVKLFVRNGVEVVQEVYNAYRKKMDEWGVDPSVLVAGVVHHANFKINKLKEKHLQKLGINLPMPWVLSEFGNVSAASNMIAFLRQLSDFKPGDHILIDGFGAGTYYDVLAVALTGRPA